MTFYSLNDDFNVLCFYLCEKTNFNVRYFRFKCLEQLLGGSSISSPRYILHYFVRVPSINTGGNVIK